MKTSHGVIHLAAIYGAKCTRYPDRSARRWTGTLSYPGKVDVCVVGSRRATFDVSYAEKSDLRARARLLAARTRSHNSRRRRAA